MYLRYTIKNIIPSVIIYVSLIAGTILLDYLLHLMGLVPIGRWLGIVGTIMITVSFAYSMKKRKMINWGSPKWLLQSHEFLGWAGALMILVHGGIHFNALIPWLAICSMLVVVASGLTGKFLLKDAKQFLSEKKGNLRLQDITDKELEQQMLSDSLLVDTMQKWRKIHMPLSMIFFALASLHIIITLLFWRWQ